MEMKTAFESINKKLESFNEEAHFTAVKENGVKASELTVFTDDNCEFLRYTGKNGSYKVIFDNTKNILTLACSADNTEEAEYKEMTRSLFDPQTVEEKDIKSAVNELLEELVPLYRSRKKDIANVKLPRSATKSAIKNGVVSYSDVDLASRFVDAYPELKDDAKAIMVEYEELLPETFFLQHGTPFILEMLRSKEDLKLKKLFKLLNDIYENGTNSAQDVIAVTILGEMKNDASLLETADKYMCEYMTTPVHEVNKIIGRRSLQAKLTNPPAYKPKKQKKSMMSSLMNGGQPPQK